MNPASARVTLAPATAITAGAQWQIDSGAWQNSGTTITNLALGIHTIAFKAIAGWTTPSPQSVTLITNGTTLLTGTYAPINPASTKVTLAPRTAISTVTGPPTLELEFRAGYPLLRLSGVLGGDFVVQYSSDVERTDWINLFSVTNLQSSPCQLLDTTGQGQPVRFYRAFMR